jgi:hypothetical protein
MIKKTVSRKTIIKAINEEPLKSGEFVLLDNKGWDPVPSKDKNCQVCAVGAVLRRAGLSNNKIHSFGDKLMWNGDVTPHTDDSFCEYDESATNAQIESLIRAKMYLHALSVKFEYQADKTGHGKRTRKILTNFVKENFPATIKLNPKF